MMRTRYAGELEAVRQNLIAMGETTIALLAEALRAVVDPSPDCAAKASELEARSDHQHRLIHDYAYEMVALVSAKQGRPPSQILNQISGIGAKIREVLSAAIDSWRNEDRGLALSARPREARSE